MTLRAEIHRLRAQLGMLVLAKLYAVVTMLRPVAGRPTPILTGSDLSALGYWVTAGRRPQSGPRVML